MDVGPLSCAGISSFRTILVRKLDRDLELDRHQVVAAHLPGAAGHDEALHCRQAFFASQRFASLRQHSRGVSRGRLRRSGRRHLLQRNGRKKPNEHDVSGTAHTCDASPATRLQASC